MQDKKNDILLFFHEAKLRRGIKISYLKVKHILLLPRTDLYCGDATQIAHVSQSFTATTQEANITCCFIETTGRHVLEQLASTYRKGGADILRSATLTWLVLSQSAALELGATHSAHTHLIALQIISAQ